MSWRNFVRRRWFNFRAGHSFYLAFLLSFTNFIVITYALLIERVRFLGELFPTLSLYIIFFLLVYPVVATLVGFWHHRTQMKVDLGVTGSQHPVLQEILTRLKRIEDKL